MRSRLARIVIFAAAGLSAGRMPTHAQQADGTVIPKLQDQNICPGSSSSDEAQPSGPEVSIDQVTFSGLLQMPISDQDEAAASIREIHGDPLNAVIEEALERTRAEWQDRGYFKVEVSGITKTLTSNATDLHIALFVHVDEGLRYNLGGITFTHNKAISNIEVLRALFPINDGDILSREKIAKGLENLRKAYGEYGYINFTAVPIPSIDDEKKLAFLKTDLDEGKQFYIGSINILGLDELAQQALLKHASISVGQIYNHRLYGLFLSQHASIFPDCPCRDSERLRMDAKSGIVVLTFDARLCPAE